MFCSNCGKQIPDNTKFCNYCGAQQQKLQNTESAPKTIENQQPQKAPKKKANIIVVLAVVLCAFLIGKFVIAPSMGSDSGKGDNPGGQGGQSQQSTGNSGGSSSAAYDAIFEDTYIVHFQTFFNMEMKNFASKMDDGTIYCVDFGYKDDVVKQWVETFYIPVSELTDTEKAEVETTMIAEYATKEALNCCTVTYKMSTNYFTITCTFSDVDKSENYGELYNVGAIQKNTFISMSETETILLGGNFVKK